MKSKGLFKVLLLSSCCLTACVDSKYDLGNVNTDDIVFGESWTAPLGSGSISAEDVVSVDKVGSIKTDTKGAYSAVYTGILERPMPKSLRADGEMVLVASHLVNTGDLGGLFDDDFVLAFTNPHVKLESNVKTGSVDSRLDITAMNQSESVSTYSDFTLSSATPNVWIGPIAPAANDGFKFVENKKLPEVLQIVPTKLQLNLLADAKQLAKVPEESFDNLKYTVEIPFIPAPEFRAVSTEHIENAFDQDFVDYIFSSGSATIYGEVKNDLPFDLDIKMVILDESNKPLGIEMETQSVTGASGEVKFEISEKHMPLMVKARHIALDLYLKGRSQGESLKKGQKTTLSLKIKKQGGISI